MPDRASVVTAWVVAIGTLLAGVAAILAYIKERDDPVAKVLVETRKKFEENSALVEAAKKADVKSDQSAWQAAVNANSPEAYESYVALFPDGAYVSQAMARRAIAQDEKAWQSAMQKNTAEAYEIYAAAFPHGANISEARTRANSLRSIASPEPFSLTQLDAVTREIVLSARAAANDAESARNSARNGVEGYWSSHQGSSMMVNTMFGRTFEGKLRQQFPELGVWKTEEGTSAKLRATTDGSLKWAFSITFIGNLTFTDKRVYEGESKYSVMSRLGPYPNGRGAMWSDDGSLIGHGIWEDGVLQRKKP